MNNSQIELIVVLFTSLACQVIEHFAAQLLLSWLLSLSLVVVKLSLLLLLSLADMRLLLMSRVAAKQNQLFDFREVMVPSPT